MKRTGVHVYRMLLVTPAMLVMATCLANAQDSPEVKQWQVFEVKLTAVLNKANPYVAYLQEKSPARVKVRFTGVSGEAAGREMTVAGFWDGGTAWKARFAPPAPGGWVFESHSEDPGLNGVTGKLTCTPWTQDEKRVNPTRRGFVRVHTNGEARGPLFRICRRHTFPLDRGHLVELDPAGDPFRNVQESGR